MTECQVDDGHGDQHALRLLHAMRSSNESKIQSKTPTEVGGLPADLLPGGEPAKASRRACLLT